MKKQNRKVISRRNFMRLTGLSLLCTAGTVIAACGEEPNPTRIDFYTVTPARPGTTSAPGSASATSSVPVTGTAGTGTTQPSIKAEDVALNFLKAWEESRYQDMYGYLSTSAKGAIDQEKFMTRYGNIAEEATLSRVLTRLGNSRPPTYFGYPYEIDFTADFSTARAGDFSQQNTLYLVEENGRWRVDWRPTNIFSGLVSPNLVRMVPINPERGNILDNKNQPLAKQSVNYVVYVVPGRIENEEQLLTTLSQNLQMDKNRIKDLYKNGQPTWRMDIKRLPGDTSQVVLSTLVSAKGVGIAEETGRFYPAATRAAHLVGYTGAIPAEELKKLAAKGYREDDVIGRTGVEAWAEDTLAGIKGGRLTIIKQDGSLVQKLSEKNSTPAGNVVLNLDMDVQKIAEEILGNRVGSIVVMEPGDGAVRALASFPRYDPNAFAMGISAADFKALNDDPRRPFQNRPVNGLLPPGSTFKVITMAAALERIGMKMDTRFTCTGRWTGLGEQNARDCYVKTGHGSITLYQGLVSSCDYVFYEVSKILDETDPILLPAVTKGFGLGASTGLTGLFDSPGQVPDGQWKREKLNQPWVRGDAVNLGIGQGYLLVTPLQMATLYSAIANGGQIPVPRLAAKIEGGPAPKVFAPATKGTLPVSPTNLDIIKRALADVCLTGTAASSFASYRARAAGKTGTAESGKPDPHAWFCCYAPVSNPKYTVVVVLEEGGFGAEKAVPLARQLLDRLPM
jgi:penicillin-binding protein 2